MQMDDSLAPGPLMEIIHILGHDSNVGHMLGKLDDS